MVPRSALQHVSTTVPRRDRPGPDVIEQIIGEPILSYRAAYWSVTNRSLWALDELAQLGFRIDSSIFPVRNWRYGIADFSPEPRWIETSNGRIFEVPVTVCSYFGMNVPVSGGAYFRIYLYALTRRNFAALFQPEVHGSASCATAQQFEFAPLREVAETLLQKPHNRSDEVDGFAKMRG